MRTRFSKAFWALNLATVGLCAYFAARAVGGYVTGSVRYPAPGAVPERQAAAEAAATTEPRPEIKPIVSRNVFCSGCAPAPLEDRNPGAAPSNEPVRTSLPLRLIATLVSSEDPAWSFAAVLDSGSGRTRLLAVGGRLADDARLTAIEDRRVLLENAGRRELLELDAAAGAGPQLASLGHAVPAPTAEVTGVRALGENRYELQRAELNRLLSNPAALGSMARIVPTMKDGKPNGLALDRLRPGSVLTAIGLQSGDVLQAVNGRSIRSPEDAIAVYTGLRSLGHVTISLARRSRPVTLDYTIR